MQSALYYPHTDVKNPALLANALLLWDSLETIVPTGNWQPERLKSPVLNKAVDVVVRPRKPSPTEQQVAHKELVEAISSGHIASLIAQAPAEWARAPYLIYPDKFLRETWHQLEAVGLAHFESQHMDYGVPRALGLLMMTLLADSCAGTEIQKVTDRVDAYSWLAQARARTLNSNPVGGLDVSQVAPAYDRLVTLSLKLLDARAIPLDRLITFREREAKGSGADYAAMRRRFRDAIDAHIARASKGVRTNSDLKELERQFLEDLKQDLHDLKSELGLTSLKTLFSKEVAISTVIAAGTFVTPIPGLTDLAQGVGLAGIIPLAKAAIELRGARRAALLKHKTSWLYLASKPRITLR